MTSDTEDVEVVDDIKEIVVDMPEQVTKEKVQNIIKLSAISFTALGVGYAFMATLILRNLFISITTLERPITANWWKRPQLIVDEYYAIIANSLALFTIVLGIIILGIVFAAFWGYIMAPTIDDYKTAVTGLGLGAGIGIVLMLLLVGMSLMVYTNIAGPQQTTTNSNTTDVSSANIEKIQGAFGDISSSSDSGTAGWIPSAMAALVIIFSGTVSAGGAAYISKRFPVPEND